LQRLSPKHRLRLVEKVIKDGESVSDICRKLGISRTIFYYWKRRYERADKERKLEYLNDKERRYYQQATPEQEKEVLRAVIKHPSFSSPQIVNYLAQKHRQPIIGNHGVQNILKRNNLNIYSQRLIHQQIHPRSHAPYVIGLLLLLSPLIIGFLLQPEKSIGYLLAFTALFCGIIFFLYSIKYYLSLIVVFLFSTRYRNGNTNATGLIPDYEKLALSKQPFVSIHLPFYNEKKVANRILAACTSMDYENYEVVVVDDSTDETMQVLEKWKSHPRVKIIHRQKREGWKGGALKVALVHSDPRTEFVIVFDADFVPYPDTIWQFLKYFNIGVNGTNGNGNNYGNSSTSLGASNNHNNLENGNYKKSNIAAVQGYQWHVLNKNENWITQSVRSEFSGSYVVERPATEINQSTKLIAGSVYMIRADLLREYGWGTSITEDFELTLRLYKDGYKVIFTPYIQAPAECPSTLKRLIRQRMRWAEGHTFNIKNMFGKLFRSPNLTFKEKLEFCYLSPYYLQATFFVLGTLCWFISDVVFETKLPFWTSVWGWSLVGVNFLSLPLMNSAGLFIEEAPGKDYRGIFSFIFLVYLLVPFQAYAALKGLLETNEGTWFRTPKSGKVTDIVYRFMFRRWLRILFPRRKQEERQEREKSSPLQLTTSNNRFDSFQIQKKTIPYLARTLIIILLSAAILLIIFAKNIPTALANPDTFYLHKNASAVITGVTAWQLKTTDADEVENGTTLNQSIAGYVDPDGDAATSGWVPTPSGTHFTTINDAIRQPTVPDTTDYISAGDVGGQDDFDMTTFTTTTVTSIKVWVYGENPAAQAIFQGNIYVAGAWQTAGTFTVGLPGSPSWGSITYDGSWTQADLDNLKVRLIRSGINITATKCFAMYAEVTYTGLTGWWQFMPGATNTTFETESSHSSDGKGWIYDTAYGAGVYIPTGTWTFRYRTVPVDTTVCGDAVIHLNVYKVAVSSGSISSSTFLFHQSGTTDICDATVNETVTVSPNPSQVDFDDSQKYLYVEYFRNQTAGCSSGTASNCGIGLYVEQTGTSPYPNITSPTVVIPEYSIVLIAIIPFLPWFMRRWQKRKK